MHTRPAHTVLLIASLTALAACGNNNTPPSESETEAATDQTQHADEPRFIEDGPYITDASIDPNDNKYVKCWVQLANRTIPNGYDSIRGPVEVRYLRDLKTTNYQDWTDKVTRVATGPSARVILYTEENFKGDAIELDPNTKSSTLEELGIERVGSLEIEYDPGVE